MAALFDEIVSSLSSRVTVRSIADEAPGADVPSLGTAAVLAVPAIIVRLTHSLTDQGVSQSVLQHLAAIDPAADTSAGSSVDPVADRAVGSQVVDLIFGDETGHVVDSIATEADIGRDQAAAVLPTSAWLVLTSVAKQYGNQLDNPSLVTVLDRERRDLMTKGWAPWIEKVSREATVAEPVHRAVPPPTSVRPQTPPPIAPPATPNNELSPTPHSIDPTVAAAETAPPTVRTPTVPAPAVPTPAVPTAEVSTSALSTPEPAASLGNSHSDMALEGRSPNNYKTQAAAPTRQRPASDEWSQSRATEPRRSNEREPSNKRFSFLSLIAGALLMLGALALIGWFQSRGNSDSETNVAEGSSETTASEDGTASADDPQDDTDGNDTATGTDSGADGSDTDGSGDAAAPADSGDRQLQYSIEMNDPLQRSDAAGVIDLDFDEAAGQLCYGVETTGIGEPYDGHIHVGPPGVKGGIVVDFGPVTDGETYCTDVAATDMSAILAQPAAYYVEMHDPTEEFTIRAQMSDDPLPAVAGSVNFDPDGNGATTNISAGRIVLDGPVPDQETMDRMIAEVAGLDESRILVVNDLVVTDGADLPTGRITVADSILFALDSDQLGADTPVIEDLALLFNARPEWTMNIVGHTDSTGNAVYNLELSLRRAAAVRDALANLGVEAARLRTEGLGARDPVASNDTEAGRAQNRRIEFRIDRS